MTSSTLPLRTLTSSSPTPRSTDLVERARQVARTDDAPIWEPVPGVGPAPRTAPIAIPDEATMIAVIERRIDPVDGHRIGNDRKERELMSLFGALTVVEAWELRRRIDGRGPGDALAASFQRLVVERRARLLAFLGDARRRAALAR